MKFENLFHIFLIILLLLSACKPGSSKKEKDHQIQFQLSTDSSAVELHHANAELLEYLRQDTLTEEQWQSFFAVYPDPQDKELRDIQKPMHGNYVLQDSLIIFVPAEKFQKGSGYLARYYNRRVLNKPLDMIRQKDLGGNEFSEFSFKLERAK